MIAKFTETEGVCLDGKWKGWLFRRHPDGQWVSVRKLDEADPLAGSPHAALFAAAAQNPTPAPTFEGSEHGKRVWIVSGVDKEEKFTFAFASKDDLVTFETSRTYDQISEIREMFIVTGAHAAAALSTSQEGE